MNADFFDAWSRRAALAGPGAAGLATVETAFAAARNTNGRKKNNVDKKAKKKCQSQLGPCNAVMEDECGGDPVCLACCEFAGRCDFAGFVNCVTDAQSGGEQ